MTIIGWITLAGVILMVLSLFVAQAADGMRNKVLFNIANVMTLLGAVGMLIGLVSWMFG